MNPTPTNPQNGATTGLALDACSAIPELPWFYAWSHEPTPRKLWDEDDMRDFAAACLIGANELCRSALAIASRDGANTNWPAFRAQLEESLKRQHAIIYREQNGADQPTPGEDQ